MDDRAGLAWMKEPRRLPDLIGHLVVLVAGKRSRLPR